MKDFGCPRCGRPLRRRPPPRGAHASHALEIRCPTCRYRMFDYPRPCAGILLMRRGNLLVVRRGQAPKRGWLDTPGGFIDAGEEIESAARRELMEETGLRAGRCEPFGMYWDRYYLEGFGWFPTMNFYFLARSSTGVARAGDDAATLEWMPLERVGRGGARLAFRHMNEVIRDLRRRVQS